MREVLRALQATLAKRGKLWERWITVVLAVQWALNATRAKNWHCTV